MTDIVFAATQFPDAYPYVPYEASIGIKGEATAITAGSISSGALPPGLTLNADNARITGTVTGIHQPLPKVYTFKVTLTDTAGAVQSANYTITVREPAAALATLGGSGTLPVTAQMAQQWPLSF